MLKYVLDRHSTTERWFSANYAVGAGLELVKQQWGEVKVKLKSNELNISQKGPQSMTETLLR